MRGSGSVRRWGQAPHSVSAPSQPNSAAARVGALCVCSESRFRLNGEARVGHVRPPFAAGRPRRASRSASALRGFA